MIRAINTNHFWVFKTKMFFVLSIVTRKGKIHRRSIKHKKHDCFTYHILCGTPVYECSV